MKAPWEEGDWHLFQDWWAPWPKHQISEIGGGLGLGFPCLPMYGFPGSLHSEVNSRTVASSMGKVSGGLRIKEEGVGRAKPTEAPGSGPTAPGTALQEALWQ